MSASKWKPYPVYKSSNELLGAIPHHWNVVPLKRHFDVQLGKMLQNEPKTDTDTFDYYLKSANIQWEGVSTDKVSKMWFSEKEKAKYRLKNGDLLISEGGDVGRSCIFEDEIDECYIQNAVNRVRSKGDTTTRYLYYWMKTMHNAGIIEIICNKSTIPHFTAEKVAEVRYFNPSIEEKNAIVHLLEIRSFEIQSAINGLQKSMEKLEEERSTLITQAVTKGLNPDVPMKETGLDWYPEVPSHWKLRRVKHIATISPSNVDKKKYDGQEEVRLANYVDVYYNDRITEKLDLMVATASDNEIAKFSLKAGDLIITKDSETWDDIAVPAFVPKTMEGVVCGYHLTLIRPNQEHILGEFLFRTYQTIGVQDQYYYNANGVTRYGLGSYWVDNGIVPVPPLKEQREIAEYIDNKLTLMEMIREKTASKIEKLKEYQTALISAGVTGKIDIRESD
jgi:type I restriction enzyme, S subunit